MIARSYTVAFEGLGARLVEVQCAISSGSPALALVGLPDKAVSEARERVRAALLGLSIALPQRRITLNLAPADLPKEGSHFDLAIALALLAAIDVLPRDEVARVLAIGEISLDGRLVPVAGALPAAMTAAEEHLTLLCPAASGAEAAWVGAAEVLGAESLPDVLRHFTGQAPLPAATPRSLLRDEQHGDLRHIRGQERAKRALEIAAAGRHHLFLLGTPGAGKSLLAKALPSLLPPLSPQEALESSMVHSVAGLLQGGISLTRPFREPHHTASRAALVGGGKRARPGEIALAHHGILFLDELPEFSRDCLESLRQPLENGEVHIDRAQSHIRYPCRFLLVAAANPCRCGYLTDAGRACGRAPLCGETYLSRLSGPLMDRFDMRLEVPPVPFQEMDRAAEGESSATVAARVAKARRRQADRYAALAGITTNADLKGEALKEFATPDAEGRALMVQVAEKLGLTARGYHRILRLARSIADLDGSETLRRPHLAEAVSYRLVGTKTGL